jgi:hypothetical protein
MQEIINKYFVSNPNLGKNTNTSSINHFLIKPLITAW